MLTVFWRGCWAGVVGSWGESQKHIRNSAIPAWKSSMLRGLIKRNSGRKVPRLRTVEGVLRLELT